MNEYLNENGFTYTESELRRQARKEGISFEELVESRPLTLVTGKQKGSTEDPTMSQESMGSQLDDGSSEEPEISAWQSFKNNISNAFEMVGDVPEFYGVGTGDKSVEEVAKEGDLGAYSGLSIASTLIYESVFGKDKMKEMAEKNPNFFKGFSSSDSKQFQDIIENFEIEKQD